MKKLGLFIICFVLLGGKTKVHSQGISLNGIPQDQAISNIYAYQKDRGQDKNPTKQSIWLKSEDFTRIVDLLLTERKASINTLHPTDGLRIYFASTGRGAGRLRTSIIMVPTVYWKDSVGHPEIKLHHDYYNHEPADLAMLAAIKDKIFKKRKLYRFGEGLYDPCTNCDVPCTIPNPGPHYIDRATAEEMVKHFGLDTMRTNSEWFNLKLLDALAHDKNAYDGMRLYFAKHGPNDPDIHGQKVRNKEAIIWVPTKKAKKWLVINQHVDHFDCDAAKKFFDRSAALGDPGTPGGYDNGELCPSNCDPIPPVPPAGE